MNEKPYWIVKREGQWAWITCPHCMEWYQVPNRPGEVETYHHCPWCAKPLFVKKEDKLLHGSEDE